MKTISPEGIATIAAIVITVLGYVGFQYSAEISQVSFEQAAIWGLKLSLLYIVFGAVKHLVWAVLVHRKGS